MSLRNIARSTTNRDLHQRADAELNLIPLIDIMSVMVAFLLVYSADVEVDAEQRRASRSRSRSPRRCRSSPWS